VDDDETVGKHWLSALLSTKERFEADVVFGPVIPKYPIDTPEWIKNGGFFEKRRFKTGVALNSGATCNALIDLESIRIDSAMRFDSRYGLSGGEDSELFFRLKNRGCKFVWSDEAVVYEAVFRERMKVSWLLRRAFRGGQTTARIHHKSAAAHIKLLWFIQRSGFLSIAFIAALLSFPFGKPYWVLAARKVMSNAGQMSIVFVENYFQEYGAKR
jgi:succinoglycan biosynthesis protein ExoM